MTTLVLLAGCAAAFAVMTALWMAMWRRGGWFARMYFFERDGGAPAIWIVERLASGAGYHVPQLALLSIDDGRRSIVYTGRDRERLVLVAASARFLWWWSSRLGLHTRDPGTGAVVLDEAALLAKAPELRGKLIDRASSDACNSVAPAGDGGVRVRTSDARVWTIDAELRAAPSSEPWREVDSRDDHDDREARVAEGKLADGRTLALWGKPRQTPHLDKRALAPDFLDGELAWDGERGRVVELADPPAVVVVHRDKLGDGAALLVSRMALDGQVAWTRSEAELGAARARDRERGQLAWAAVRPDGLYLVVNRMPYTVLVLDPASGAVRRRFPAA